MDEFVAVSPTFTAAQRLLLRTVLGLRHIAVNVPTPVRLCLSGEARTASWFDDTDARSLISDAYARIGVHDVRFVETRAAENLSSFECVMSRQLSDALLAAATQSDNLDDDLDGNPYDALMNPYPPGIEAVKVAREPGVALNAYATGRRDLPPLLMVLPFGMPLDLCLDWFTDLGTRHRVITWETRCLFGDCDDFDAARIDLDAQIDDLFAVMQHFKVSGAQVMGICGGAVVALAAAARPGDHVRSLSLWYGDYPFADADLRTRHQANFEWLMEAASQTRDDARGLQGMFVDPATLATTPAEIAHLSLYPYVNAELLYRYARLNDALNKTDIMAWLPRVTAPTLVVTGDSDETTHAGGSVFVADRIADAQLHVEPGGSHTAFFGKPAPLVALAHAFLREHATRTGTGTNTGTHAVAGHASVGEPHTVHPDPVYQ